MQLCKTAGHIAPGYQDVPCRNISRLPDHVASFKSLYVVLTIKSGNIAQPEHVQTGTGKEIVPQEGSAARLNTLCWYVGWKLWVDALNDTKYLDIIFLSAPSTTLALCSPIYSLSPPGVQMRCDPLRREKQILTRGARCLYSTSLAGARIRHMSIPLGGSVNNGTNGSRNRQN